MKVGIRIGKMSLCDIKEGECGFCIIEVNWVNFWLFVVMNVFVRRLGFDCKVLRFC